MLVSAIMPTSQYRRAFIPRAIQSFLSQDWSEKELVVVDSGLERVEDLFANVPNVKYVFYREENRPKHLPRTPIGTKRNIACENASGEIICHWDDDDLSLSGRITDQVSTLVVSGKSVTGYNHIKEVNAADGSLGEYAVPENMTCGTSLCYRRDYWVQHRFRDTSFGEDWAFAEEALELGQLSTCDGRHYMVATKHQGNTSKRD